MPHTLSPPAARAAKGPQPRSGAALRCRGSRRPSDDELLRRYTLRRLAPDLEALVLRYRPLALSLARRYRGAGRPPDDLEQAACMGLIKALQRFDPGRGCAFTTFAVPTILGELRRFCRDTAWTAHVPRGMQERARAVRRTVDDIAAERGRAPKLRELTAALDWPEEDVVEALCAASTRVAVPLESGTDAGAHIPGPLDRLGAIDPGYELVECLAAIEAALPALSLDEKKVLRMRFDQDLKLHEIGRRLGVSEGQAARLLSSGLGTLRRLAVAADERSPAVVVELEEIRRSRFLRSASTPRSRLAAA